MNRNRRVLAIIILIIGFLVLGGVGVVYLMNLNQPQSAAEATPPPQATLEPGAEPVSDQPAPVVVDATSELVEVVISLQTLPRGYRISGEELETDLRLVSQVGDNVITRPEDLIGKFTRTEVFQGETFTRDAVADDLTEGGQFDYGPSSLIPFGSVAYAVPMDRLSSVAYGLDAGDSVDVMFSLAFSEIDTEFRTLLRNSVTFYLDVENEEGEVTRSVYVIDPYGRFETLPTGDLAHLAPSEEQRSVPVSFIIQNAKVIHVGPWQPPEPPQPPTPTPDPNAPTPTPGGPAPTPTPSPPDVLLVALPPQQQLLLKYAIENGADVDYALRAAGDGQINAVTNVDLNYLIGRFNIEIPPDTNYTINPAGYLPNLEEFLEEVIQDGGGEGGTEPGANE